MNVLYPPVSNSNTHLKLQWRDWCYFRLPWNSMVMLLHISVHSKHFLLQSSTPPWPGSAGPDGMHQHSQHSLLRPEVVISRSGTAWHFPKASRPSQQQSGSPHATHLRVPWSPADSKDSASQSHHLTPAWTPVNSLSYFNVTDVGNRTQAETQL